MDNKYAHQAAEARPHGYVRVRSGRVLETDLVWSWTDQRFIPANDPSWTMMVEWVSQAVYVIREGVEAPREKVDHAADLEYQNAIHAQQALF